MANKPELQNIMPEGGLRRGELHILTAGTDSSRSALVNTNLSELEERIAANIPKRVATIPASEDADCLFCKAVFKLTMEGSAGKHTTCPVCKSYHEYGEVIDGEVKVKAMQAML
ncbi:hypothetical protein [Yersinia ruckeri]|uniref:hypothetical protein n=1 Tax=Yersinia ruckeri TaxID=29486 RepID=UPI0022380F5B|nr:hypothetical protein [Yersinia ruckeri]MCW6598819.1 hypothetical protein [Yersinia ruckeri]